MVDKYMYNLELELRRNRMRQTMLTFLATVALLSGVTFATAEEEEFALEAEKLEFAHGMRLKELEVEARKAELEFESQMRELELDERRAEKQRPHRGSYHHKKKDDGFVCLIMLVMILVRILATIWVCGDRQRRKAGSALWIPIVILTGLFGLLVYAVTRIGDTPQTQGVSG
jgi:hypothetical protein